MVELPPGPYQVVLLGTARQQLWGSMARAKTTEVKRAFLGALERVFARLVVDPLAWGEPVRRYRHAGLLQMQRLQDMLLTVYAVDDVHKVVYVKECKPVLSHPLASS